MGPSQASLTHNPPATRWQACIISAIQTTHSPSLTHPQDTRLLLSWHPPGDGSCVDTYVVDISLANGTADGSTPLLVSSVDQRDF